MGIARSVATSAALAAFVLNVVAAAAPARAQAPDLIALKRDYRRPPPLAVANPALAGLGRELFFDPRISASGKTACATCHVPALGWVVTDARPRNDSGKPTSRKSQPLIGLGHAGKAPVGWDGRSPTLEAQAKASIATGSMSMRETDTPVKVETIEARIRSVPEYVAKFAAALPGRPIDIDAIAEALAAFERTIEPGPAPFDRWVGGDEAAIPAAAKRGFALFTGRAGCSACHSGWRFTDDNFHDIGTTTTDPGRGRAGRTRRRQHGRQQLHDERRLQIDKTVARQQAGHHVGVLGGRFGGQRRQRAGRQAEVETDRQNVPGAHAGTDADDLGMAFLVRHDLVEQRQHGGVAAVHDRRRSG